MVVWTPGCKVMLVGMGEKGKLDHHLARATGARVDGFAFKEKWAISLC